MSRWRFCYGVPPHNEAQVTTAHSTPTRLVSAIMPESILLPTGRNGRARAGFQPMPQVPALFLQDTQQKCHLHTLSLRTSVLQPCHRVSAGGVGGWRKWRTLVAGWAAVPQCFPGSHPSPSHYYTRPLAVACSTACATASLNSSGDVSRHVSAVRPRYLLRMFW